MHVGKSILKVVIGIFFYDFVHFSSSLDKIRCNIGPRNVSRDWNYVEVVAVKAMLPSDSSVDL